MPLWIRRLLGPLWRFVRSGVRKASNFANPTMLFPTYSPQVASRVGKLTDSVRYATIALAIQRLEKDEIAGAFAELGVYQGTTSRFIHLQSPNRRLYLFDTFEGFPLISLEVAGDNRFKDTSQKMVAQFIGDEQNIVFRPGFFPDTAAGLEDERFAFVMLDFDLYQPALDSFKFFYPRLVSGGFFMMHDFNSPESNYAISRAAREFLADKPEQLVEIPDVCGSALFRKI